MYLDTSDERVLAGEFGETPQKMMEILVALGRSTRPRNSSRSRAPR